MKGNKNQYFSIYIKKSISKPNANSIKSEVSNIAVKKLMNNDIIPQAFYKPITRILNIETDVS